MNFGEIRVFRFKRAQGGAEAIPTDLGIDTAAQFVVVDEKMPIIFEVFVAIAHVYRETGYRRSLSQLSQVSNLSSVSNRRPLFGAVQLDSA